MPIPMRAATAKARVRTSSEYDRVSSTITRARDKAIVAGAASVSIHPVNRMVPGRVACQKKADIRVF